MDVQQLRARIRQQLNGELNWAVRESTSKVCFDACVPKFGDHLSPAEKECLCHCTDTYRSAFDIVSMAFARRWKMGDGDFEMLVDSRSTKEEEGNQL